MIDGDDTYPEKRAKEVVELVLDGKAEDWLDYFKKIDYLYLYKIDEQFLEKYGKYFDYALDKIQDHSMFYFDKEKNKYVLC